MPVNETSFFPHRFSSEAELLLFKVTGNTFRSIEVSWDIL